VSFRCNNKLTSGTVCIIETSAYIYVSGRRRPAVCDQSDDDGGYRCIELDVSDLQRSAFRCHGDVDLDLDLDLGDEEQPRSNRSRRRPPRSKPVTCTDDDGSVAADSESMKAEDSGFSGESSSASTCQQKDANQPPRARYAFLSTNVVSVRVRCSDVKKCDDWQICVLRFVQ
jgi:hypothetical protein